MTTSILTKCLILLLTSTALAQNPPSPVRINGNEWTIKEFERPTDFTDDDGYTNCSSHTIYWRNPQYQTTQWIIWHELLHAGACYGTLLDNHYWDSPDAKEHRGIYRLTYFMYEFTRDNPEMAKWLIGEK